MTKPFEKILLNEINKRDIALVNMAKHFLQLVPEMKKVAVDEYCLAARYTCYDGEPPLPKIGNSK